MAGVDDLSSEQKLKVSVLCDVKRISQEVGSRFSDQVIFDQSAVELIAEMAWRKLHDYAGELELFARHGKRSKINPDDVKLLVRKNVSLKERISQMSDELSVTAASKKRKRDKDSSDGGAGPSDVPDVGADDIGNSDMNAVFDVED